MKVDIEILNRYVEEGWVERNDHPTLPISIYNYSRNTQYEGKWDEITLMCRGLVLDKHGTVVAKSFNKFFNMEEHKPEEIPNGQFEVFEKLDGSLGILFNYQGEWILATKGSFTSDQAVKGMEILKKYKYDRLLKGYTYLFEIIYPENRIVCQYDFEDLILLAVIDNHDGYEIRIHDNEIHLEGIRLKNLYNNLGFKIVKKYDGIRDYSELKSKISQNEEGFVIKFGNGFRMKIKGEEYVRLHRILTGFSNVDIWEYLKDGRDFNEFLDRVPDEFDEWVKTTIKDLKTQYETLDNEYKWIFKVLMRSPQSENKKGFAELAKKYKHPSILFRMFDGKEYSNYIWKQIRPVYSKPFWQKESNYE
jgi:RNA ligase